MLSELTRVRKDPNEGQMRFIRTAAIGQKIVFC